MKKALLGLTLLAALGAAGCSGQPDDGEKYTPPSETKVEDTVKKIENDPNMTPQQKEMAIAAVKGAAARSASPPSSQ